MNLVERLQLWALDPLAPLEETLGTTREILEPIASHYVYGALPAKYHGPYTRMRRIPEDLPTKISCVGNAVYNLAKIEFAAEISEAAPILNLPLWGVKIYAYAAIISSATRLAIMAKTKKPVGTPTIRIIDDTRRGLAYILTSKND
jgi:hypothetical protein